MSVDKEEITVIGRLPADGDDSKARASGRVARFREQTRSDRMRIADEAEDRYRRKVSWGSRWPTVTPPSESCSPTSPFR